MFFNAACVTGLGGGGGTAICRPAPGEHAKRHEHKAKGRRDFRVVACHWRGSDMVGPFTFLFYLGLRSKLNLGTVYSDNPSLLQFLHLQLVVF